MEMSDAYSVTKTDVIRMTELASMEFQEVEDEDEACFDEIAIDDGFIYDPEYIKRLLNEMGNAAFSGNGDQFAWYAQSNKDRIRAAAEDYPEVVEMLVLGYRMGITSKSGACMNDLGALYYMGDLVEQDYQKAAELYEMAMKHGCFQSIINLGYIYEYGRIGQADHAKAYEYYSLAAALEPSSEAAYKLGDMYSRCKAVKRNLATAHMLWERSLRLANNDVEEAQPAIRIANLLVDPQSEEWGITSDPLRALELYQHAEIGLRIDIADGQTYYQKRLAEAIAGQDTARSLLECDAGFFE